jgi:hypothetical protein
MKYIVKGHLQHNGEKFEVGDEIDLTVKEAEELVRLGRLEKATAKTVAAVKKELKEKEKEEEKKKEEAGDEGADDADEDKDDSDEEE